MKIDLLGYKDNALKSWKNVWNASNPQSSLFTLSVNVVSASLAFKELIVLIGLIPHYLLPNVL